MNSPQGVSSNTISKTRISDLEQAIEYYQQALGMMTRPSMPVAWSATLHNLGLAYAERLQGEQTANIEKAIVCYRQALGMMTRASMPVAWAINCSRYLSYLNCNRSAIVYIFNVHFRDIPCFPSM